ncbi:TetR/AcrR family transcriptional regulator [Sphaerisporangium sp. TRM90804]|uniref:TetR/AcrR family transcriptional regulator n=1 Tax=Sphaerisporangium sp. TRM90804 TaxID=3031113 RepID=UPI002448DD4B|nr:TetR/AcrR family transcriptional regulator [Sphaerisporangium sp. TRM90804]MDH2430542.1 TetR/AcrR family transcriptional regulator [Sphaerisporangium sp. TRM90804]
MTGLGQAEPPATESVVRVRRLRRTERREQLLDAATRAFARTGYPATGLDDVAAEAGLTRAMLYRHFDSKADMYRAVLDRACVRLTEATGADDFDDGAIPALVRAAAADPDGFRLLFRHAVREPDFRDLVDELTAASRDIAHRSLARTIPPGPWLDWASRLVPALTIEAVIAWLDAGQPDPGQAAERVGQAVHGVMAAALPGAVPHVPPPATAPGTDDG